MVALGADVRPPMRPERWAIETWGERGRATESLQMIRRHRPFFIAAIVAVPWLASGPGIGTARADDVQINTYTTGFQTEPSVSLDADGDFVVVWDSRGSSGSDTDLDSVQGQRYASDSSTAGAQFQVNTLPASAALPDSSSALRGSRATSTSRLNSAAPYNTHAWPPINRWSTRCFRIVERALRIGLGIKRASHGYEVVPEPGALVPALRGRQQIPVDPLRLPDVFGCDHRACLPDRIMGPTGRGSPTSSRRRSGRRQSSGR